MYQPEGRLGHKPIAFYLHHCLLRPLPKIWMIVRTGTNKSMRPWRAPACRSRLRPWPPSPGSGVTPPNIMSQLIWWRPGSDWTLESWWQQPHNTGAGPSLTVVMLVTVYWRGHSLRPSHPLTHSWSYQAGDWQTWGYYYCWRRNGPL